MPRFNEREEQRRRSREVMEKETGTEGGGCAPYMAPVLLVFVGLPLWVALEIMRLFQ